jgi:protein TonB
MTTRFLVPAITAVTLHGLAFLGWHHPRPAGTDPKSTPTMCAPVDLTWFEPPEETPDTGPVARGHPDVARSEDTFTQPRDDTPFVIVTQTRITIGPVAIHLSPGPIGPSDGIGELTGVDPIASVTALDNIPRTRAQIAPAYPFEAKREGLTGDVLVEFTVTERGEVTNPRIIRSNNPIFDEPTLRAVSKWRFEPGRKNGRIVRFRMAQPIVFAVND